jgi:hypothetical protein
MKLAMVTTARAEDSPVGAYSAALAAELAKRVELTLFVEPEFAGDEAHGARVRRADELLPREFDQVLYQIGDDARLAFMAPMVRALGGAVALHDWELYYFACELHPRLRRGGLRSFVSAALEGGLAQAAQHRRRLVDASAAMPALNRSIVRFGDAFVTHSEALGRAILDDRNAPTPIGTVAPLVETTDAAPDAPRGAAASIERCHGRWDAVAARYVELLERFPKPRSARKTLLAMRLAAAVKK